MQHALHVAHLGIGKRHDGFLSMGMASIAEISAALAPHLRGKRHADASD